MATTPVPQPLVTVEQQVLTDLHNKLHSLIYAHIGIVLILIASLVGGGYAAYKMHEHDLAHAEQLQAAFNASNAQAAAAQKQLVDVMAADNALRAQQTAQQAQVELAMAQRAQAPLAAPIANGLKPSAQAADVITALSSAYGPGLNPSVTPDGKIAVPLAGAQAEVQKAVDLVRAEADLQDTNQLWTLEKAKSTSLSNDLTACQGVVAKDEKALADAGPAIKAYAKIANQSKFRRILGSVGRNAERVVILIVGVELGHKF